MKLKSLIKDYLKEQSTVTTDSSTPTTVQTTDTPSNEPIPTEDPRIKNLEKEKDSLLVSKQKLAADTAKYKKQIDLINKNHVIPSDEKNRKIDNEIEDKNDKIQKLKPSMNECETCGCNKNTVNFDKFFGKVKECKLVEQNSIQPISNVTKQIMAIVGKYRNTFNSALHQAWGQALQQLKSLRLSGSTISFDGYTADSTGAIKSDNLLKGLMVEVINLYLTQAPEWLTLGDKTGIVLLVHGRDLNDNNREKWYAVNGYKITLEPQVGAAEEKPAVTENVMTKSNMIKLIRECIDEVIDEDFQEGKEINLIKHTDAFKSFYYELINILNDELKSTEMNSTSLDKRTNKIDPSKIYFYSDIVTYLTERDGKIIVGRLDNGKEVDEKEVQTPEQVVDYMGKFVTVS